jgi:hypothetical protein
VNAVEELLERYKAAHAASGSADPRPYLEQVDGIERVELAAHIDRFLAEAPPRAFDPAAFAAFRTDPRRRALVTGILDDVTLAELRQEAGIKRQALAVGIAEHLGLSGREARVRARLHDIEIGEIEPARVRPGVWKALSDVLGTSVDRVRRAAENSFGAGGEAAAVSFARSTPAAPGPAGSLASPEMDRVDDDDDVDRAFFAD